MLSLFVPFCLLVPSWRFHLMVLDVSLGNSLLLGIAGLACAYELSRYGHRVHVLEASSGLDRVSIVFSFCI